MTVLANLLHVAVLLALPPLLLGVIQRTKALWAGRKGPRLLQGYSDLRRLLRKRPVYSVVTTGLFRLAPVVLLASTLVSGAFAPLRGASAAPVSFPYDFVVLAYLWGLGRLFLVLSALDTGSAFEGMGASREATYAAIAEPALFLALGTLAAATGHSAFADLAALELGGPAEAVVILACLAAVFVFMQVEAARVPVDDPTTHLELTMIHEVMVLDHAGPELAAVQYASAMKLTICAAFIAALVNPLQGHGLAAAAVNVALTLVVAAAVGCVESLVARLRLRAVPQYVLSAVVAALVALLTTSWWQGGAR
jgi:formate hydrogenlyase subunit 4